MKKVDLKAKDILLTLLYLPGTTGEINEPIIGKTRITKMMFLFEKELYRNFSNIDSKSLPEFFAYDYGPFSKDLLDDIRFFCIIGFVTEELTGKQMPEPEQAEYVFDIQDDVGYGEEDINVLDIDTSETKYSLTEKGIAYVKNNILEQYSEGQKELLTRFKGKLNSLSLDAILAYVYNKYPDSARNSKIKDKYLKV